MIILVSVLINIGSSAQVVDLSDIKKTKTYENSIPYDSSFLVPDTFVKDEQKAGLKGQTITILDISSFDIENSQEKPGSYNDEEKIEGKEWTIINYFKEGYNDKYKISKNGVEYTVTLSSINKWFINGGLKKLQDRYIGKKYLAMKKSLTVRGVDDKDYTLTNNSAIQIKDLQYAKLDYSNYALVLFFNNGLLTKFDPPPRSKEKRIITIGADYSDDYLIEESYFNTFKKNQGKYYDQIANGKISIGMSHMQTRYSWGMTNRSKGKYGEFDFVNIYKHYCPIKARN